MGYPTTRAARTVLNRLRRHKKRRGEHRERSFYRCEFCGDYLTSLKPDGHTRFR